MTPGGNTTRFAKLGFLDTGGLRGLDDAGHRAGFRRGLEKEAPVIVVLVNQFAAVSSGDDLVKAARVFDSDAPSHEANGFRFLQVLSLFLSGIAA